MYVGYFKCDKKMIREFPNLKAYVADVYQMPGMAASVNIDHIKTHYYTSHPKLNYYAIIPKGCPDAWWETLDHGRATKFA